MPRGWLLDTNAVWELRKEARCHPAVRAWAAAVPPAACFLSRITIAEIRAGIPKLADPAFRTELGSWLRDGVRAWFGERILDEDEEVRVARMHRLGVATRAVREFQRAGLDLLDHWA